MRNRLAGKRGFQRLPQEGLVRLHLPVRFPRIVEIVRRALENHPVFGIEKERVRGHVGAESFGRLMGPIKEHRKRQMMRCDAPGQGLPAHAQLVPIREDRVEGHAARVLARQRDQADTLASGDAGAGVRPEVDDLRSAFFQQSPPIKQVSDQK